MNRFHLQKEKKMKVILPTIALGLSVQLLATTAIAKSQNTDMHTASCKSSVEIAQPRYEGFAVCSTAKTEESEGELLKQFVPITGKSQVELKSPTTGNSCIANVPYSYSESKLGSSCKMSTQSVTDIDYFHYEYGACNYYTRQGSMWWEHISGASYLLQEKNGSSWYTVYSGSSSATMFNKVPGPNGKSYQLRLRATVNGQTGSWHNYSVYVPGCWNGGGPEPK